MQLKNTKLLSALMVICLTNTALAQSSDIPVLARPSTRNSPTPSPTIIDIVPPDTQELIKILQACDITLEKCKKANADKDVILKQEKAISTSSLERVRDLEKSQSSFWNSKLLWFSVGALFTGMVVNLVKK